MSIKKVLRKMVAGSVISSMLFSSTLCFSPFLPLAEAATVEHKSSSILPFLQGLRNQGTAYDQQGQTDPISENETQYNTNSEQTNLLNNDNSNPNQTTLSQSEIDKIVNEHMLSQGKAEEVTETDKAPKQATEKEEPNTNVEQEDQKVDRFIIKYINEDQKEDTLNKVKEKIKKRIHTKNKKFDVYVTTGKMKIEEFQALLKQKKADSNIEYMQPDYPVTVASAELPQDAKKPQRVTNINQSAQLDDTPTDTQIPILSTLTFEGLKLELTYEETLNSGSLPSSQDFVLKAKEGQNVAIASLEINQEKLVITLAAPIASGESITLSYIPGTNPIQDLAGNPAEGFTEKQVESSGVPDLPVVDTEAPILETAEVNDDIITLKYNEILKRTSIPDTKDFSLVWNDENGNSIDDVIKNVTVQDVEVTLTLNKKFSPGQTMQISYIPGTDPIQDLAGNSAEGFTEKQVESSEVPDLPSVDTEAPILETAEVNDSIITLKYNETLKGTSIPDIKDFSLVWNDENGNSIDDVIKNVTVEEIEVTLTLNKKFSPGQTMQISYIPGINPIQDLADNSAKGYSNLEVVNQSKILDSISPVLKEATINVSALELSFDEPLKSDSIPADMDFCLSLDGKSATNAIQAINITGEKVIITLKEPVTANNTYKISYTPDKTPLMDLSGNKVEEFKDIQVDNITSTPINDPHFAEQWGLLPNTYDTMTNEASSVGIDAVKAWKESEGKGVIVAVLDTGIDITHEDLKDNIWTKTTEIPGNGLDDDGDGYIDDVHGWNFVDNTNTVHNQETAFDEWHGTHVAGIIAADKGNKKGIVGVAPKAKIMPLQVFKNGSAYTSDIINAILYAQQNGAQVVNCSWGTTSENTALKEAIEESGLLFICAAGNSYKNIDDNPVYPASLTADNIIAVASIKKTGNLSRFSNHGQNSVDVAAPGEEIISSLPGNAYGQSGGTSQAAAFVTGEVAMILSKYPNATISEIKARIIASSDKLSSLTAKLSSAGKINCASALTDPVSTNDTIIQVPEETILDPGNGSTDGEDYDLYSVDEWNVKNNLSAVRGYFGTVAFNGKIYCIGGKDASSTLQSVDIYDPVSNTSICTSANNLLVARYGHGTAVVGEKIYAIGGYGSSYLNSVEGYKYNEATQTYSWSSIPADPNSTPFMARKDFGTAVVNGKIYTIGGLNSTRTGIVQEYDPQTNIWTNKATMTARSGLGVAAVNGKIYAIGGVNGSYVSTVEVYDPSNDSNGWVTKASLPKSLAHMGVTTINGKIYCIGGYNGSVWDTVYEYDPIADVWGRKMSTYAKYALGATAVNGKIYALGGTDGSSYLKTVYEYGLPSNNWKTLTNMSIARSELGTAAVDGKIYAIGGFDGTSYKATVEQYDPVLNTWSNKVDMNVARCGFGTAVVDGKIYVVGGYNGTMYLDSVDVYDPSNNSWTLQTTQNSKMPTPRGYFGLTAANGKLYAIGGYNGTSYLSTVEEYDPVSNSWNTTPKANMTTARGYLGVTAVYGKIYAIGGFNGGEQTKVEEYNPVNDTWNTKNSVSSTKKGMRVESSNGKIYIFGASNYTNLNFIMEYDPLNSSCTVLEKETMPTYRYYFGITSLNNKIYTIGGSKDSNYYKTVEEYTPTKNPWSIKANMLTSREKFGAVSVNGKIYAVGGTNGSNLNTTIDEYDPKGNSWTNKAAATEDIQRKGLGATALDGKIFLLGGYGTSTNTYTGRVDVYDPALNNWSTKPSITPRSGLGVTTLNGKVYAIGGEDGTANFNSIGKKLEIYDSVSWVSRTPMNTARCDFGIVAANNLIYVIGGRNSDSSIIYNTVEVYDPVANTWSYKANMSSARYGLGAVVVNGKIFAIGGVGADGSYLNTVEEYDLGRNLWTPVMNMPTARDYLAVAEANGKLYAIGGSNNTTLISVEEYDPGTLTWTTKKAMTTERSYLGVTSVNGKIYAIGGTTASTYQSVNQEYNPVTNSWSSKSATSFTARNKLGAVSLDGKIYAIGGYNGSNINTVQMYDPETDTWTNKDSLNAARREFGVAAVNGKIYVIGGYGSSLLNSVEEYDPTTNNWTTKSGTPTPRMTPRYGLGLAVVDGKIYAIGGNNNTQSLATVEVYDPVANTWNTKTSMPTARSGFGIQVVNDKIYVLGGVQGINTPAQYLDTNEVYDPATDSWSVKSAMPTSRAGFGVTEIDGKIYAIGGIRYVTGVADDYDLNRVEVYDPSIDSYTIQMNKTIARNSLSVTDVNGKIYAIGGYDGTNYLGIIQEYDGTTWNQKAVMTARKDLGVAAVNGKIYAIGGYNGTYLNTLEEFDPTINTWNPITSSIPEDSEFTARSGLSVIAVNGRIYAIGGQNASGYLSLVEEYDPASNKWTPKKSMPTARAFLSTVSLNGLIYAIGGKNNSGINTVEVYDPISDDWITGVSMPTARYALGATVLKGKIYAIGGYDGNNYSDLVEEYDPINNNWIAQPNVLHPRAYYGVDSIGDKIYLIGGCNYDVDNNTTRYLDIVETYNPGTITWTTKSSIIPRKGLGATALNGKIYAFGGQNNDGSMNTVQDYDPATNTWTTHTNGMATTNRSYFGVVPVGDKIYAIGGLAVGSSNLVQEYDPVADSWTAKSSLNMARYGLGVTAVNGKIYAIGGYDGSGYLNSVEEYDPAGTSGWVTKNPNEENDPWMKARAYLGVVAVNGKIYAIGGVDASGPLSSVQEYDPLTNEWSTKPDMPTARERLGVVSLNGKIYAIGGQDKNVVEVYDPAIDTWTTEVSLTSKRSDFGVAAVNGKIYIIGGGSPVTGLVEEGSFEEEADDSSLSELIHLGEENINLSGNFARTYMDLSLKTPGFELNLTRTYNSRDDRTGFFGKSWSFGFQGYVTDYLKDQKIVRLPNGSAMTFTKNADGTYTAKDSRAKLEKQADSTFILRTKDQYTYGFSSGTTGWLKWMKDRNGNTITITVDSNGKVTKVTDQVGRIITITYNSSGFISAITDPSSPSRSVQYNYDSKKRLIKVTDPMLNTQNYSYNTDGYLETIIDNNNPDPTESVVYDDSTGKTNARIARLTDAFGNTSTYMYDTDYRKMTVTDLNGREKITWYDSNFYPIQVQDPDGRRSITVYNLDNNKENKYGEVKYTIDRNGNKTEYERDGQGNVTKIYNSDSYKEYTYDDKNNMLSEKVGKDQNFKYTYFVYDTSKINLITKAQTLYPNYDAPYSSSNEANFAVTNYTYTNTEPFCSAKGLLKTVTDPEGHTITYTYTTYGNIKTETNPQTNKVTAYTYNSVGWKTSVLTAKGYTTSYEYDLNGNVEKETLQGGEVTRATYDNMGRKTKVVSPNLYDSSLDDIAHHTYSGDSGYRYTYYPSGKVDTQTDPESNQTSYTYDLYGNVKTETKPNLSVYEYYYDVLDRLTDVKFRDTESADPVLLVKYSYLILEDGNTQKTETKYLSYLNNDETAKTIYTYDYLNRLIKQINPDETNKQKVFDYDGTLKTTTDESGNITYFHYDGLSRNTEQWIPFSKIDNSPLYTYKALVYDKAGNVLQEKTCKTVMAAEQVPTTNDYITITKEYYNDNKLKSQIDNTGRKTEYQYDDDRYLRNKDVYTTVTAKNTTEYVNNYFGKPISEKIHVREGDLEGNDFACNQDALLCIGYSYDKNGNVKSKSNPTAWYPKTSMSTARKYLGTAAANGKIYAIGGNSNGIYSNIIEEYNPVTKTWATKNNTNFTAREKLGVVSLDGKVYAIGGYNGSYLGTAQMYDPASDTWTNKASMSVARSQPGVIAFNGKIYAIGGRPSSSTTTGSVTAYDPATNAWTTKATMPTIRYGLGLAVVNGKIYAIGGDLGSETLNTVEEYDPVANTWIAKTAMPTARSGFGIEVVNNKIYILGGTNINNDYFDAIEEYDPASDSWSRTGTLPTASAGLSATCVDGKIYALGGVTYDTTTHDLQTVVANIPAPVVTTSQSRRESPYFVRSR